MTALTLMDDLGRRGAKLPARSGRLAVDAPVGVLTEADRDDLLRCKVELLALLTAQSGADPVPTAPPYFPPYPPELAGWPIPWRQAWGELANRLDSEGLGWWEAQ